MQHLILIIVFVLMAAPGTRLLRIAGLSQDAAQERLLGAGFLLASVGLPLRLAAVGEIARTGRPLVEGEWAAMANMLGHVLVSGGAGCLFLFTWLTFRPESRATRICVLAVLAAIVADLVWISAAGGALIEAHRSVVVGNALRGIVFPWACYESLRYWRMMRKRGALGLADPIVTNRFALWATWTGALSLLPLLAVIARLIARSLDVDASGVHTEMLQVILPVLRIVALGTLGATLACIWLSFFPPHRYTEYLLEHSRRTAAA